jgi:hypothetical protein
MVKEAEEAVQTDAGESETAAVCLNISLFKFLTFLFFFFSVFVNLKIDLIKLN